MTANIPGLPEWGTVALHRAVAARRRHRLRRRRRPPPRRLSSPYLWKTTDFGKTWKSAHRQAAAGRLPARRPRGPEEARACSTSAPSAACTFSPDDGATWQPLQAEPADRRRPRPASSRTTISCVGTQRPVDLDPRRPDAGPRVDADGGGEAGPSVRRRQPADALAVRRRLRLHRARRGRQPAGRGGHPLPPGQEAGQADRRWKSSTRNGKVIAHVDRQGRARRQGR